MPPRRTPPTDPAPGTGIHDLAKAVEKKRKVLLGNKEDFPCRIPGCPERSGKPLSYCSDHGKQALKGLVLGRRVVTASERLWLMTAKFRTLLNLVQEGKKTVEEAAVDLWDLATYHLLTDPPFHDLHAHLPMGSFLDMRTDEYSWCGVIPELRSHLPFTLTGWDSSRSPEELTLTLRLQRGRTRILGKERKDLVRELSLFFKQKADQEIETRISVHLPVIAKGSPKRKTTTEHYPKPAKEGQWQRSPLPPLPNPRRRRKS